MTPLAFGGASVDGGLYLWITRLAHDTPHAVDTTIAFWSDFGLALFGVLMLAAWWRARGAGQARMVRALAAPVIVVLCYVADVLVKSTVAENRPCRSLHAVTVEACPAVGDWSFPSNHAVIAGAAAVVIALTDRTLGWIAAVGAILMAVSRVWIGVHYPHDVAVGLAFGALLAWPLMLLADRAAPLVERASETRVGELVTGAHSGG